MPWAYCDGMIWGGKARPSFVCCHYLNEMRSEYRKPSQKQLQRFAIAVDSSKTFLCNHSVLHRFTRITALVDDIEHFVP